MADIAETQELDCDIDSPKVAKETPRETKVERNPVVVPNITTKSGTTDEKSGDKTEEKVENKEQNVASKTPEDEHRNKRSRRKNEITDRYPYPSKLTSNTSSSNEHFIHPVVNRSSNNSKNLKMIKLVQVPADQIGRVARPIEDEPFYHGYMTRRECEEIIKKDGHFLVRKTEVANVAFFVISLRVDQDVHNLLIRRTNRKRLFWIHQFAFKSVGDLVMYHYRNREPISESGYILLKPLLKKVWQLNHEQLQIIDKLGSGAFGEVYSGTLQLSPFRSRIPVAVKTLQGALNGDERIKFLREANLMLRLHHINVIQFYGVCASKEPIMIVMEKAGTSLLNVIRCKENPPTMNDKLNYCYGCCKGLAYLEEQQLIHRDIALRNFLMGLDKEVKVSDFGLSMLAVDHRDRKLKNVPLRWLAPETLKRGKFSAKTDVYSFGVVIWEIYSGGVDPYEDLPNKLIKKTVADDRIPLVPLGEINEEIDAIRKKCTAFEPTARPTFAEVKVEIEKIDGVKIPPQPSKIVLLWTRLREKYTQWKEE